MKPEMTRIRRRRRTNIAASEASNPTEPVRERVTRRCASIGGRAEECRRDERTHPQWQSCLWIEEMFAKRDERLSSSRPCVSATQK